MTACQSGHLAFPQEGFSYSNDATGCDFAQAARLLAQGKAGSRDASRGPSLRGSIPFQPEQAFRKLSPFPGTFLTPANLIPAPRGGGGHMRKLGYVIAAIGAIAIAAPSIATAET